MLALTETATEAIEGLLAAPTIPDGAGLRIAAGSPRNGAEPGVVDLNVTVASAPVETDQVIDAQGARVFVEEPVSGFLDDKVLDAQIVEQQVTFVIGEQAA